MDFGIFCDRLLVTNKFDQQGDFQSAISQNRDISYQGL